MEKLKVKVSSEQESREVQELGEQLGYFRPVQHSYIQMENGGYVCLGYEFEGKNQDLILFVGGFRDEDVDSMRGYKELTIPQLRDLVVLKRNDVKKDRTHTGKSGSEYYKGFECFYFWTGTQWRESTIDFIENDLKPIEKPMTEYLEKQKDGTYKLVLRGDAIKGDDIEVPEGSECAILGDADNIYFWKSHYFIGGIHKEWLDMKFGYDAKWYLESSLGSKMVWQRSETECLMQGGNDEIKGIQEVGVASQGYSVNLKTGDFSGCKASMEADSDWVDRVSAIISEVMHEHYKKDVSHLDFIDVYRVLDLFDVKSHAVGHAIKKLLCSGQRGAKNKQQDIQEAIDSLNRELEMIKENENAI